MSRPTSCRNMTLSRNEPCHTRETTSGLRFRSFSRRTRRTSSRMSSFRASAPTGCSQPRPRDYLNHTFSSALTLQHGTHTLKTGGLIAT